MATVDFSIDWSADATFTAAASVVADFQINWSVETSGSFALQRDISGGKQVVIVDKNGATLGTLENATAITTSHRLNAWDTYSFTIPADDPKVALLFDENMREAQIWWNDVLQVWGPMTRPDMGETAVTVRGAGAPWYLSRRHVGKASRPNQITNGGFESGLLGWNIQKTAYFLDYQAGGIVTVAPSVNAKEGTNVLEIADTMVEDPAGSEQKWGDVFIWQEIIMSGGERGTTATMVGWVWVDTAVGAPPTVAFDDFEPHRFGLLLARLPGTWRTDNAWETADPATNTWGGTRAFYTDSDEVRFARIDERTPTDQWVRLETSITIPPGETNSIICRLSGLSGTVFWDRVSLTRDDAFEAFQDDQAEIVCDLVDHAQDPSFDKNDVNLDCELTETGVLRDLVALHSQHGNIWQLISGFFNLQDGFDIGTSYTPTTRTLTTHFPQRGIYRADLALATGRNVQNWRWSFDGEAATSSMILLGTGSGSDREEASSIDATRFPDGLILETVETVDADTPVEQLDDLAVEALDVLGEPYVLQVLTVPNDPDRYERNFIGRLQVGDWLPVSLRKARVSGGWGFEIEDDYRVVAITINPDDRLALTLNRRDLP